MSAVGLFFRDTGRVGVGWTGKGGGWIEEEVCERNKEIQEEEEEEEQRRRRRTEEERRHLGG